MPRNWNTMRFPLTLPSPPGRGEGVTFPLLWGEGRVRGLRLLFHERAVALVDGPEGLLGRDGRADLVVVPRVLRLGRLLDLDQIRGVDLAPVGADRALAEERVVG